jgi:hypothetical protein
LDRLLLFRKAKVKIFVLLFMIQLLETVRRRRRVSLISQQEEKDDGDDDEKHAEFDEPPGEP